MNEANLTFDGTGTASVSQIKTFTDGTISLSGRSGQSAAWPLGTAARNTVRADSSAKAVRIMS